MNTQLVACVLFVFVFKNVESICAPNNVCRTQRGTIFQTNRLITNRERSDNRGRAWYIQANPNPSNFIMAFKNFNATVHSPVMLITYYNRTSKTVQYLYGPLGDFEIVKQNAMTIIIYVPIRSRNPPEFLMHYYSGCDILTTTQNQFVYPPTREANITNTAAKCWIIHPFNTRARERIYFSFRNVLLDHGQKVQMWDLHTSGFLGELTGVTSHHLMASESYPSQLVMVELVCVSTNCNMQKTQMAVNYYGMNHTDVNCIHNQMRCTFENGTLPQSYCNELECPALDNMLTEEYGLESNEPVSRSGAVTTNSSGMRISKGCRGGVRYCRCPKKVNLLSFCLPKIKCPKLPICVRHCMKMKIMCASMRRLPPQFRFQILL
nr:uncharacterized protein LOC100181573 isoform X1 [Ciona intestinalis]|eukprot:XP_002129157.1 uncharacterized protein LOC100181573 isoform X1 [Ciona intestinalis]